MVGKKSGRAALREEGLAKTDNNLDLTSWPAVSMINQKNYYTEYLKRDEQFLAYRTIQEENTQRMVKEARDRDRARAGVVLDDDRMEDVEPTSPEAHGSTFIVIHPGSQNLRIGLANDPIPKTVPMVIARKAKENESEIDGGEPKPKRIKLEGQEDEDVPPEKQFGAEFSKEYMSMALELKTRMRNNKRRLMPNSRELVVNFNRRAHPEIITEHNDPQRVEWTEVGGSSAPEYVCGQAALRIPEKSQPRYRLLWPLRNGWLNEKDYQQKNPLWNDLYLIIEEAMKTELGLTKRKDWQKYSCCFVIPDLYEREYVNRCLDMLMREFGFRRVCFMQESVAATYGAGYSMACIVDIGAQKTSICCVEDGMCVEESRVNMKYGGSDVTEAFMKMMLYDHFPYQEINLKRRYDFLLAEELKHKFCTMNEGDIGVQLYDFHLRASGQDTRKYNFKTYDEPMLALMAYFRPQIFNHDDKLLGRRHLVDRSYDLYDGSPNDPFSIAQSQVLQHASQSYAHNGSIAPVTTSAPTSAAAPSARASFNLLKQLHETDATPRSSVAGSPAPEGTPKPERAGSQDAPDDSGILAPSAVDPVAEKLKLADERDRILPIMSLDAAVFASITQGARAEDRKVRDFLGGIMVVGGGGSIAGFNSFLEEKLRELQPLYVKDVLIGAPPRDLDQQVVAWKGGSVFARLSNNGNDSWIYQKEYELLGTKVLSQKCMWNW
ncbi:actin-like ATPase domain-containing protein [Eremomyces bilateralis CBS 781.70]|uniref:Actin-like ATPase domain-containing protein n=1 Tax=Eremomyces bilateralis CBS 781.70 TaxID=1392243 RepID=A0A6G1G4X3_9PEZI|nr:actin-like ATPase domain-containing protein [Eremomyces bilateralis CBS 781.70]KAF1812960.1 actin-like ATPase domain-containing protein [Eremomyces bilateralis CBS 781.70]